MKAILTAVLAALLATSALAQPRCGTGELNEMCNVATHIRMMNPLNGCAMELSTPGGPSAVAQWEYVDATCPNRQAVSMVRSQPIPAPLPAPSKPPLMVGGRMVSPDGCFVVNAIQCADPECSQRGALTMIRLCLKPGDGYWTGK